MPAIPDLIKNWWKQIAAVTLLSVLTVGVITFLKPLQYLSVTTAVPASAFAADPSRIFNKNIQALYSTLGTPDDLDRVLGTAGLDTVYLAVTDQFNLFDHYKMKEKGTAARAKAAAELRKNCKVMKSEYGELKVKVWSTDPQLAPQLANAVTEKLQSIHQDLQGAGNIATLDGLIKGKEKLLKQTDSSSSPDEQSSRLLQYEKLIGDYQLMVDSKPPALIVVEKAKPAAWPDRPRRMQILVATALLSILFSGLAALVFDNRKNTGHDGSGS